MWIAKQLLVPNWLFFCLVFVRSLDKYTIEANGDHWLFSYRHIYIYKYIFCVQQKKKFMRLSKQCLKFHSWPNYPFKVRGLFKWVIMMQTELIKRGRWSSICGTQTCRQASACVRPLLPIKTLPEAFQPRPTVGQTATWCLLNLWPSTLTEPEGLHQRGETRQRPVTHPGESHINLSWMQMTRFGYKLRKLESRRCINDLLLQLPKPHIWLELERKTTKHPVSIKPPLKSDWELIEKSSSK